MNCQIMQTVIAVVCPFTPQQTLVLINRPSEGWHAELALVQSSHRWDMNLRCCDHKSDTLPHGHQCNTDAHMTRENVRALQSLLVLELSASLHQKYGTPYLFTSANPKLTLPSDVILRRTTLFQPISPPSGPCNAPWFSSETLALYKSLTYLLT